MIQWIRNKKKYYLNPQLATRIQRQFNDKFYSDEDFESSIFTEEEINEVIDNGYDPFKYYIAKLTKDLKIVQDKEECREIIPLIQHQNKIAGVITTNYDLIMESIFNEFEVLVGQDKMLTANTSNLFEIFKIHGSADMPNSIVITQADYDYFKNKLKYLSAKLLTLFVEHPIIFLGYSIGDLNIRGILSEIAECLNRSQLEQIKSNFIFIKATSNDEEKVSSKEIDFGDKRIIMTEITLKNYSILFEALSQIKSSMPVRVMRKMQDMICNFIASTEASNNIMVGNINNPNIKDEQVGIYFGNLEYISEMGFDSYNIMDIVDDILFDNRPYFMDIKLLNKTFKNIRSVAGKTYLPVHKYVKGLSVDIDSLPEEWNIIKKIEDVYLTTNDNNYTRDGKTYCSIQDIEKDHPNHIPRQLSYILKNLNYLPVEEIGDFLRKMYGNIQGMEKNLSTFKKIVAAYDFLKYGDKNKV